MCKGTQLPKEYNFFPQHKESISPHKTRDSKFCELCGLKASLYCQADDAYLCRKCDKKVHEANFLSLRHIRCFLCNTCQNFTRRYLIGTSIEMLLPSNISWNKGNLPNNSTLLNCSRAHSNISM